MVTLSIGVVTVLANDPQAQDTFISMADQATYQAKSFGRNRVAFDREPAATL